MYKRFMLAVVVMLLVLALAVPLATLAGKQESGQGAAQGNTAAKKAGQERHPEIREAIRKVQSARHDLVKEAARDFQGHRAKAVQHLDEALTELRLALQADKD